MTNESKPTVLTDEKFSDFIGKNIPLRYMIDWEILHYHVYERWTSGKYRGGVWELCVNDDGFYMRPTHDKNFEIHSDSGFSTSELTHDSIGIALEQWIASHLSFRAYGLNDKEGVEFWSNHYYAITELRNQSPQCALIARFND